MKKTTKIIKTKSFFSELKDFVLEKLNTEKAEEISCIDLGSDGLLAHYTIVASGYSSRHIQSIASNLCDVLQKYYKLNVVINGTADTKWVVLDIDGIIIHLFTIDERQLYFAEIIKNKSSI